MAYDVFLDGNSGLMSAMAHGCYDLVPIPDPKLGPRKVDVATMYNTNATVPFTQTDAAANLSEPRIVGPS